LFRGVIVRQYYLHTRGRVFYVQFADPVTHKQLPAISTGKRNRDDALIVVAGWIRDGIPQKHVIKEDSRKSLDEFIGLNQVFSALKQLELTARDVEKIEEILKSRGLVEIVVKKGAREAEPVGDYLRRFWDYDKSPYIQEKRSHGITIGKTHTRCCLERANIYWVPCFKGKTIGEVTRQDLKDFSTELPKKYSKLSFSTLKQIMLVGIVAFRWAYNNELIPGNPTIGLTGYTTTDVKKRGVLTPEEAEGIFRLEWKDKRAMLVNLVAMSTGLRIGEIIALRSADIGDGYITVNKSYSAVDGLKSPKTNEPRTVPIIAPLRDAMRRLAEVNPHGDGYVFFGINENRPLNPDLPLTELRRMLIQLYTGKPLNQLDPGEKEKAEAYWKERNVVFHSWRHFYASRMADKIEARKVMLATGHKTEAVFRSYSAHILEEDLEKVAETAEEIFTHFLPEKVGA
jgi:integrase